MANESYLRIKWVFFGFWLTYTWFFVNYKVTKLHLLCNLLGQKIIILIKMNIFLYRTNFAFSEYIFIFIVWWEDFEILGLKSSLRASKVNEIRKRTTFDFSFILRKSIKKKWYQNLFLKLSVTN